MIQININPTNCIHCQLCYKTCFADVIRWDEVQKLPIAAYPEECAVCCWCEIRCPNNCIEVIPDYTMPRPQLWPKSVYPMSYQD